MLILLFLLEREWGAAAHPCSARTDARKVLVGAGIAGEQQRIPGAGIEPAAGLG